MNLCLTDLDAVGEGRFAMPEGPERRGYFVNVGVCGGHAMRLRRESFGRVVLDVEDEAVALELWLKRWGTRPEGRTRA